MTKNQLSHYTQYRDYVKQHGLRSIYQHYTRCSTKKSIAWQSISKRKCQENGFCFTIVSGGSHFFNTGYLRRITKDNFKSEFLRDVMDDACDVELVYDYYGGTDRILLTDEQRMELNKILCLTI